MLHVLCSIKMKSMILRILILLFEFSICAVTRASRIRFEAAPRDLKVNLTTAASMRCSLADTQTSNQLGKKRETSTATDVLHISYILISRNNGTEVASVTPFDAPMGVVDLGNMQVKGSVGDGASEGFLQLTWANPAAMGLGEYICEINTIEAGHHHVTFTASLEMTSSEPTIDDVISEFEARMSRMQSDTDAKVSSLQTQLQQERARVDSLTACARTRVAFMAVLSAGNFQNNVFNFPTDKPVVFDKTYLNAGDSYDNTTGKFVCKIAGIYEFNVHAVSATKVGVCAKLLVNSEAVTSIVAYDTLTHDSASMSAVIHLKLNDVVQVQHAGCGRTFYNRNDIWQPNVFDGHLVHSDNCLV